MGAIRERMSTPLQLGRRCGQAVIGTRVIASRPFATTVPQEIPVSIPLLFISEW